MSDYSADLHLHTSFSDGTFTPQELVCKAHQLNFDTIAITDHDTIDAIPIAERKAKELNLNLIPGVELTAELDQTELHLLGYYIQWNVDWFKDFLRSVCKARIERMRKMVGRLNDFGIDLEPKEVLSTSENGAIGRLHLANVLYKKNIVSSTKQAFDEYIGDLAPCCVKKYKLLPKEAIGIILKLKGVPVVAHPGISMSDEVILELIDMGIKGIEIYHPGHSKQQIKRYEELAKKHNLVVTGGSDCHGRAKEKVYLGNVRLGEYIVKALEEASNLYTNE